MSCDWDKYSSPEETRQRAKIPRDNAVISMVVGDVRNIAGQGVIHTPIFPSNRAHTDITGEKTTETRVLFGRIYQIIVVDPKNWTGP